jgi:hypothetical protein
MLLSFMDSDTSQAMIYNFSSCLVSVRNSHMIVNRSFPFFYLRFVRICGFCEVALSWLTVNVSCLRPRDCFKSSSWAESVVWSHSDSRVCWLSGHHWTISQSVSDVRLSGHTSVIHHSRWCYTVVYPCTNSIVISNQLHRNVCYPRMII